MSATLSDLWVKIINTGATPLRYVSMQRPATVVDLVAVGESLGGWVTMWHAEDWDEPRRVLILPLDEQ